MTTIKERFTLTLLTAFGLGLSPIAPGTVGTLLGVAQFAALCATGSEALLPLVAAAWFGITWALAPIAIARWKTTDPGAVVSDEVCGYLTALLFTGSTGLGCGVRAALAFVLFRIFDIAKPGPVRSAERLPGGLGIALDDVVAGVLANLCLQTARWL